MITGTITITLKNNVNAEEFARKVASSYSLKKEQIRIKGSDKLFIKYAGENQHNGECIVMSDGILHAVGLFSDDRRKDDPDDDVYENRNGRVCGYTFRRTGKYTAYDIDWDVDIEKIYDELDQELEDYDAIAEYLGLSPDEYEKIDSSERKEVAYDLYRQNKLNPSEFYDLPKEVAIPYKLGIENPDDATLQIADWLSDNFGFCVKGFRIKETTHIVMDYLSIYSVIQGALAAGSARVGSIEAIAKFGQDDNPESIELYADRVRVAKLQKTDSATYELIYKHDYSFVEPLFESEKKDIMRVCHELTDFNVTESNEQLYLELIL